MLFFRTTGYLVIVFFFSSFGQQVIFSQNRERPLSLYTYMEQVKKAHLGIKSAALSQEATGLREKEKDLLTTPTLFATSQILSDRKQTLQKYITGDNALYWNSSTGVSLTTDSGWKGKLYYDLRYTSYPDGIDNTVYLPNKSFFEASPVLEINKSLIKNANGEEIKASQAISESTLLAQDSLSSFKTKQILSSAEQAYWQLAFSIEAIKLQEESVQHAVDIREWTIKREALHLTDHADALQALASLKLRQLELLSAMNDKRIAIRNFNALRGIDSDQLSDSITTFEDIAFETLTEKPKRTFKDDLKALEYTQKTTEMNTILAKENLKPDLNLFGSLALNTRQNDLGNTALNALSIDHTSSMIGIKYTLILDPTSLQDIQKGLELEMQSSQLAYDQKRQDQNRDCLILVQKLDDSQKKLQLALAIESAQKEKWSYEVQRHIKGRTTTSQVINFEQDYLVARINKVKIQAEILQVISQLKEYSL